MAKVANHPCLHQFFPLGVPDRKSDFRMDKMTAMKLLPIFSINPLQHLVTRTQINLFQTV